MNTFDDVIVSLGGPAKVAKALNLEQQYHRVHKWGARNYIPAEYWRDLLLLASRRHVRVTARDLVRIAHHAKGRAGP